MDLKIRILRLNLLEWMVWGRFGGIVAATMNTRRLKISYKKKGLFSILQPSQSLGKWSRWLNRLGPVGVAVIWGLGVMLAL